MVRCASVYSTPKYWNIFLDYSAPVIGWTPQLLSVKALRAAVEQLYHMRHCSLHELLFANPNYTWTEYATYFLVLKEAGLWGHFHKVIPHSGDIDGSGFGRGQPIRGCLHLRIDSLGELNTLFLSENPEVPLIMIDDHKVNGSMLLRFLCIRNHLTIPRPRLDEHLARSAPPVQTEQDWNLST